MHRFRSCIGLTIAISMAGLRAAAAEPQAGAPEFFRERVAPLLAARCLECHGVEKKGLDLRSRASAGAGGESGPAFVPKQPDDSLLVAHVRDGTMPPKKRLAAAEVAVLERWIAGGAWLPEVPLDPFAFTTDVRAGYDWWSLRPIRRPPLPAVRNASRVRTPVDRFLVARLEAAGLHYAPPAARRALIRRATLDLTGLLPSWEEVEAFAGDDRPDAYERLVDRLLASPHYGVRWGRHWLDVVRFAESNGFERDRIRVNFWPYRDYVIDAFRRDIPFDRFVREQLAGDALPGDDPARLVATGFLVAGPKNDVGTVSELEQLTTRQDELDEFVAAVSTTFLGLTVACARCHDHKFDPISQLDYYGLTAVFSGLDRGDQPAANPAELRRYEAAKQAIEQERAKVQSASEALLAPVREKLAAARAREPATAKLPAVRYTINEERFAPVRAKFVRFTIAATSDGTEPCLDELAAFAAGTERNVAAAVAGGRASASSLLPGYPIHQVAHLNEGLFGNSHSWISSERGAGWAQVELAEPVEIDRVAWGRDRDGKFLDRLPTVYRLEVSTDGQAWTRVADERRRTPFAGAKPTEISPAEILAALAPTQRSEYDRLQAELAGFEKQLQQIPPLPTSYSARDGAPRPAFVLRRGDVRSPGELALPNALRAIGALPADLAPSSADSGPARRLALAEWILDPRNPLTARVLVNRVWHYHFGEGLVATPSDFGFSGDRPSHPELLDWLAAECVDSGWELKRLHRLLMLSEAYRQSAAYDAAAASQDADARLLWRFRSRRFDAETLRDAMLQTAGTLDAALGGPSFRLFEYRDGNVPDYVLVDRPGRETWRRTAYAFNIRTFQAPLMSAFDCPDASVQTPKRVQSVTPQQALSLLNNSFAVQQAAELAGELLRAKNDPAGQATAAFRRILLRDPTAEQLETATEFVRAHGLAALCRVLWNTNEFLYVE